MKSRLVLFLSALALLPLSSALAGDAPSASSGAAVTAPAPQPKPRRVVRFTDIPVLGPLVAGTGEWLGSIFLGSAEELTRTAGGAAKGAAKISTGATKSTLKTAHRYGSDTKTP